ncbi:putative mitochondrial protein [Cucumis melo var. makuwa]|uniref:Mitochondrial protein n=1 Tax=Cucumis melo var. makuwa TaxID=1194695 RepID=A0A5A7UIK0_CUCMM|nr:putative mitochondrial protein [Cucumis melo var. makuwa]
MVSEHDIEKILDDHTHGGTLAEETASNISATVAATIEARISTAMDKWFQRLQNSPASLTQPHSFANSIPSAAQGLHVPLAPIPPSNAPSAPVQPNPHVGLPIQVHSLYGPASEIAQSIHALPHAPPSGLVQPPISSLVANLSVCPEVGNPQAHSTFEVGESSAQSQQVQGLSPSVAQHQLDMLRQQIAALEATLGAPSTTHLPHRYILRIWLRLVCLLGILCNNKVINASTHLHSFPQIKFHGQLYRRNLIKEDGSLAVQTTQVQDFGPIRDQGENDRSETNVLKDMGKQGSIDEVIIDKEDRIVENEVVAEHTENETKSDHSGNKSKYDPSLDLPIVLTKECPEWKVAVMEEMRTLEKNKT